jgi:hypothetical protein
MPAKLDLGELHAHLAIEAMGYTVENTNLTVRHNCPNVDLGIRAPSGACAYVQVKATTNPANKDSIIVDGGAWTKEQLFDGAPIFNKTDFHLRCALVILVDMTKSVDTPDFYIIPPLELEQIVRPMGQAYANEPKRNGAARSISFRKEVPRSSLLKWQGAWNL